MCQCLTEDVSTFCTDLAHIYSHLSKPCLDVVLMAGQLILLARHRAGGDGHTGQPVLLAALVIFGSGYILKLATPPFGKMIAEQARLYGDLRAAHSRVIAHSEEIAFYGGHVIERTVLQQTYDDLIRHINFIYRKKIWFTMLEQFLMRSGTNHTTIPRSKGMHTCAECHFTHLPTCSHPLALCCVRFAATCGVPAVWL